MEMYVVCGMGMNESECVCVCEYMGGMNTDLLVVVVRGTLTMFAWMMAR